LSLGGPSKSRRRTKSQQTGKSDSLERRTSPILDEIARLDPSNANTAPTASPAARQATNVIDWIETPGFLYTGEELSAGPALYPRSHEIFRDFYELLCPYCQDVEAIRRIPLDQQDFSKQIIFKNDVCLECGITRLDCLRAERLTDYEEFVLISGMRAGKSFYAGRDGSYLVHRLLGLPSTVRKAFGLMSGPPIEIAFVASTALQTKDTIWANFKQFLYGSPWFQIYLSDLRRREMETGKALFDDEAESRIDFIEKGFVCVSRNSNSSGLAGSTRLACYLDELARFGLGDSKISADEVYRVLSHSLKTLQGRYKFLLRRGVLPPCKPMMFSISSPIHDEDKIMRLGRNARQFPGLKIFFRHYTTPEMNPEFTQEDFAAALEADPVGAERDFMAKPLGIRPRLLPEGAVEAITTMRKPLLTCREEFFEEADHPYVRMVLDKCRTDRVIPRWIHCDPGYRSDSFGIVIGHLEGKLPHYHVVYDACIEFRPLRPPRGVVAPVREVHFPSTLKFLQDLRKHINIAQITYDHWNSVYLIQQLRAAGLKVDEHNINVDDYDRFAADAIGRRIELPAPERPQYDPALRDAPATKAYYELRQLERANEKRVDHPRGGSSDLAICFVGVHRLATQDIFEDAKDMRRRRNEIVANAGVHISRYAQLPAREKFGGVIRFRRSL